jgi:hypothetical protein
MKTWTLITAIRLGLKLTFWLAGRGRAKSTKALVVQELDKVASAQAPFER